MADPLQGDKAEELPAALAEGRQVMQMFPGSSGLLGKQATKSAVMRQMPRYRLLHFATHGFLPPNDPRLSGLVVAPEAPEAVSEESVRFDILQTQEIMGLSLSAQLAVLSACETSLGRQAGGEGLLGLTWAFRAAGCPSVVASHWDVDDAATGRLMARFYQELKAGRRKDDALRTAMLAEMHYGNGGSDKARKRGIDAVPSKRSASGANRTVYWAAFQAIGDCAPLRLR